MGVELVARMSWLSMNTSRMMRNSEGRASAYGLWGYKHPRTALVLPYLVASLGPLLRYVHVVRDPKEVIHGANQMVYVDMCGRYYGRPCPDTLDSRLEFWTDLNMDVYHIASAQLSHSQYLVVRTEDLVLGTKSCFTRIARFVNANAEHTALHLGKAQNHSTAHVGSYFGRKFSIEERKMLIAAAYRAKPRVKAALALFGYSDSAFKLTSTCEEAGRLVV